MEDKLLQDFKDIYTTLNQVAVKGDESISCMFATLSKLKEIILKEEERRNNERRKSD